jgi:hypothetical protein
MRKLISPSDRVRYINDIKALAVGSTLKYYITEQSGNELRAIVKRASIDTITMDFEMEVGAHYTTITRLDDRPLPPPVQRGRPSAYDFSTLEIGEARTFDLDLSRHIAVRKAARLTSERTGNNIIASSKGSVITVKRLEPGAGACGVRGHGMPDLPPGGKVEIEINDVTKIGAVRRLANYWGAQLGTKFSVAQVNNIATVTRAGEASPVGPTIADLVASGALPAPPAQERRAEERAPEDAPPLDIAEQKRLAAEVLAAAARLRDEEF